jgi:hypothetical protein
MANGGDRDLPDGNELLLLERHRTPQERVNVRHLTERIERVKEGVSVRLGIDHKLRANRTAASRLVDDHHGLSEVVVGHAG